MGIIDLGRGIYTYNGVAQATRELARATSVHLCDTTKPTCVLGSSPETTDVRGTQNTLVPGLSGAAATVTYTCTSITDTTRRDQGLRLGRLREGVGLRAVPGHHPPAEHGGADDALVDDPHRDPVKESIAVSPTDRPRERGQMLALFAICLVAIIAMTGLVIDGGLTMVQRRDQQNVADAAAMAGAYDFANNYDSAAAIAQARANAAANGYANGVDNVVVDGERRHEQRRRLRHDDGHQAASQLLLRDPRLRQLGREHDRHARRPARPTP